MGILADALRQRGAIPEDTTLPEAGSTLSSGIGGEFVRGLDAGTTGIGGGLRAMAGTAAQAMGFDDFAKQQYDAAQAASLRAQGEAPRVSSYKQVMEEPSLRNATHYAAGLLGGSAPSLGLGVGAALATGGAAVPGLVAGTLAQTPIEAGDVALKQLGDPDAMAMSPGERLMRQGLGGAGSAALQSVVPAALGSKLLGRTATQAAAQSAKQVVGRNLMAIPEEGVLEGGAEALKQTASNEQRPLDWESIKENTIGGAVAGAPMGAAGAGAELLYRTPVQGLNAGKRAAKAAGEAMSPTWDAVKAGAAGFKDAMPNSVKEMTAAWGQDIGERTDAARAAWKDLMNADDVPAEIRKHAEAAGKSLGTAGTAAWLYATEKARAAARMTKDAMPEDLLTRFREMDTRPDQDLERMAQGKPLVDDAELAGANDAQAKSLLDKGVEKAKALGASTAQWLIDRADLSPQQREGLVEMGRNIGDAANQAAIAAMAKGMKAKDAIVSRAEALIAGFKRGADEGQAKKSEDFSGYDQQVMERMRLLLKDKHPELLQDPKAMMTVATAVRLWTTAMAEGRSTRAANRFMHEMLGADTADSLAGLLAVQATGEKPGAMSNYFTQRALARKQAAMHADLARVIQDNTGKGRLKQYAGKPEELASQLLAWASGEMDKGKSAAQREHDNAAVHEFLDQRFGAGKDDILAAVERTVAERAPKAVHGAEGEPVPEGGFGGTDKPNELGEDVQYHGGGKHGNVLLSHPDKNRAEFNNESVAERVMKAQRAKHPEGVDARFVTVAEDPSILDRVPGHKAFRTRTKKEVEAQREQYLAEAKGDEQAAAKAMSDEVQRRIQARETKLKEDGMGMVQVKKFASSDALGHEELNSVRLDTKDHSDSASRLDVVKGENPITVDALRLTHLMEKKTPYSGFGDKSRLHRLAEAFHAGVAALMAEHGTFDIPDTTVIGKIGAKDVTYGQIKKLREKIKDADGQTRREASAEDPREGNLRELRQKIKDANTELKKLYEREADGHEVDFDRIDRLEQQLESFKEKYERLASAEHFDREKDRSGVQEVGKDAEIHMAAAEHGEGEGLQHRINEDGSTLKHGRGTTNTSRIEALRSVVKRFLRATTSNSEGRTFVNQIARTVGGKAREIYSNYQLMSPDDQARFSEIVTLNSGEKLNVRDTATLVNELHAKYKATFDNPSNAKGDFRPRTRMTPEMATAENQRRADVVTKKRLLAAAEAERAAKPSLPGRLKEFREYLTNPPKDYTTEGAQNIVKWAEHQVVRLTDMMEGVDEGSDRYEQLYDWRLDAKLLAAKGKDMLEGNKAVARMEGAPDPKVVAAKKAAVRFGNAADVAAEGGTSRVANAIQQGAISRSLERVSAPFEHLLHTIGFVAEEGPHRGMTHTSVGLVGINFKALHDDSRWAAGMTMSERLDWIMSHELGHVHDLFQSQKEGLGYLASRDMAALDKGGWAYEEAAAARSKHPLLEWTYQYPLDAVGDNHARELYAQNFALFKHNPELMREHLPKTYEAISRLSAGGAEARGRDTFAHSEAGTTPAGQPADRNDGNESGTRAADVEAKKQAFLERAASGDKALIDEISKSTDAKGLQRALDALLGHEYPGRSDADASSDGVWATLDALNARLGELVRDNPDVAYGLQTKRYSMDATGMDSDLSPEGRAQVLDTIRSMLGDSVQVEFAKLMHAGEFTKEMMDDIIRISVHALNPTTVAYHESLHAFFSQLRSNGNGEVTAVLERAANMPHVMRQLRDLLAHSPEALRQLADPEERAAYMFQFWADGRLQLTGAPKTLFTKIKEGLMKLMGIWTNDERALHIMDYFSSGEYAAKMHDHDAVRSDLLETGRNRVLDKLQELSGPFVDLAENVLGAGSANLRDSGVPTLGKLADMVKKRLTDEGEDAGYLPAARLARTQFLEQYASVIDNVSQEHLHEALEALQNGTKATSLEARTVQRGVRKVLDDMFDYLHKAGVDVNDLGVGKDYFPRRWDAHYLSKHKAEFMTMARKYPDWGNALDTYNKLVANDGSELQVVDRPGMSSKQKRVLSFIDHADAAPFMSKDLHSIMNSYITQATRRAEWARRFADDNSTLAAMYDQARAEGATTQQIEQAKKFVAGVNGTLGDELNPTMRRLMGDMIVYQNIRLLPLAVFSMAVDPMGVLVRGGTIRDAWGAFKRGIKEIPKGLRGDLSMDADTRLAADMGVIDNAVLQHALGSMYTQGVTGDTARKFNDTFFKYNLVEQMNVSMRVAATAAATRFLVRHADGNYNAHSMRFLSELGLKPGDLVIKDGELVTSPQNGLSEAQAAKVRAAINQWVDGAVLRPDAADKPVWMNDPHFMLFSHLKQFVYAFHHTILDRVAHEARHGNYGPSVALMGYVPVMIAADMAKGMIQGGGDEPEWKKGWTAGDYISNGVQRAGLFGVGQFGVDAWEDIRRGGTGIGQLTGPTLEQFGEAVKVLGGREQFKTFVLHSLPANQLYANAFGGGVEDPTFAE